jgi:hypothetical protein
MKKEKERLQMYFDSFYFTSISTCTSAEGFTSSRKQDGKENPSSLIAKKWCFKSGLPLEALVRGSVTLRVKD